jgi:rhodanese-related sulfurtransferase
LSLFSRTPSTDPAALAERLGSRAVLVLDVRQPDEWRRGHIRTSVNVPLSQLRGKLTTLPRDRTVVAVCASGHRSAAAARVLRRAGYEAENLKGGMYAWSRSSLPVARGSR